MQLLKRRLRMSLRQAVDSAKRNVVTVGPCTGTIS
jgi:hypothetical protein